MYQGSTFKTIRGIITRSSEPSKLILGWGFEFSRDIISIFFSLTDVIVMRVMYLKINVLAGRRINGKFK